MPLRPKQTKIHQGEARRSLAFLHFTEPPTVFSGGTCTVLFLENVAVVGN